MKKFLDQLQQEWWQCNLTKMKIRKINRIQQLARDMCKIARDMCKINQQSTFDLKLFKVIYEVVQTDQKVQFKYIMMKFKHPFHYRMGDSISFKNVCQVSEIKIKTLKVNPVIKSQYKYITLKGNPIRKQSYKYTKNNQSAEVIKTLQSDLLINLNTNSQYGSDNINLPKQITLIQIINIIEINIHQFHTHSFNSNYSLIKYFGRILNIRTLNIRILNLKNQRNNPQTQLNLQKYQPFIQS